MLRGWKTKTTMKGYAGLTDATLMAAADAVSCTKPLRALR